MKKVTEPNTANYLENFYDDEGRRTQLDVHYGSNVWKYDYSYDSAGNPKHFRDETYGKEAWYLYDEAGRLVKAYYGNNTAAFYEYDSDGRVTQVRIEEAGEIIDKFRYEYNVRGDFTKVWSDMKGTWVEYNYDPLLH